MANDTARACYPAHGSRIGVQRRPTGFCLADDGPLFYSNLTLFYGGVCDRMRKEYQNMYKPEISDDHKENLGAVLNNNCEKRYDSSRKHGELI